MKLNTSIQYLVMVMYKRSIYNVPYKDGRKGLDDVDEDEMLYILGRWEDLGVRTMK